MVASNKRNEVLNRTLDVPDDFPVVFQALGGYKKRSAHIPDGRGGILCGSHNLDMEKAKQKPMEKAKIRHLSICGNCLRYFLGYSSGERLFEDDQRRSDRKGT
jgi:hypothetical protein